MVSGGPAGSRPGGCGIACQDGIYIHSRWNGPWCGGWWCWGSFIILRGFPDTTTGGSHPLMLWGSPCVTICNALCCWEQGGAIRPGVAGNVLEQCFQVNSLTVINPLIPGTHLCHISRFLLPRYELVDLLFLKNSENVVQIFEYICF